jgi:hypothetical protein
MRGAMAALPQDSHMQLMFGAAEFRKTGGNRSWRNFSCGNKLAFRGGDVAARKTWLRPGSSASLSFGFRVEPPRISRKVSADLPRVGKVWIRLHSLRLTLPAGC